jgi:hypothetical protein
MLDKYSNEISDCDILIRSFWLAQLPQKNELGVHVFNNNASSGAGGGGGSNDDRNTKNKIKKYKSQIERLKEKIRNQNVDIEEALKRLSVKNKRN